MRPAVVVSETPGEAAGKRIIDGLAAAIAARGRATLAVPGGSSPAPVFRWLATHLPPAVAAKTTVTLVDERHVAGNDAQDWQDLPQDSNLRGLWAEWLSSARPRPAVVPLDAPGTLNDACDAVIQAFVEKVGRVDVVLLGAGGDGHIASLFPGRTEGELAGPVVAVDDSPKPPPERLSLTRRILEDTDVAVLIVTGAGKADMLRRALDGDDSLPLSQLNPRGTWTWVLDPAAASQLEST